MTQDEIKDFFDKRAKPFMDKYGEVSKEAIMDFFDISESHYYRIKRNLRDSGLPNKA